MWEDTPGRWNLRESDRREKTKLRWLDSNQVDCVANDIKAIGATEEDAKDRNRWRKLVSATATRKWEPLEEEVVTTLRIAMHIYSKIHMNELQ